MRRDFLTSAIAVVLFTVALGVVYPLAITGTSQLAISDSANGSLTRVDGKTVGSNLIGQAFTKPVLGGSGKPKLDDEGSPVMAADPSYFQSRPSATGYAPNLTSFGNLGPNSKAARDSVKENMAAYLKLESPYDHELTANHVPVDAVTQSASGVDPHISLANAWIQAHRVASVRGLSLERANELISDNTDGRALGVFGEPGVNVLALNIAMDREVSAK